jgi:trehalose 2-sulfotransferase
VSGVWEPLRAELDTEPPRDPDLPSTSYVVCSTPRSGSGLLCRGLASTGRAGVPAEYFNDNQRIPLAQRWGAGDDVAVYVAALRARRTSPDGVFATKLHWDQLVTLRAEVLGIAAGEPGFTIPSDFLDAMLGEPTFIRIVRLDVDRQAVSLWTALRGGVWSVRAGASPAQAAAPVVDYSFDGIAKCRRFIVDGELHWDRFLRFNAIEPVEVVHERLVESYAETIVAVMAAALGTEVDPASLPAPDSVEQANRRSQELYERFVADRGELPQGITVSP